MEEISREDWDRYMANYDIVVAVLWPYRQLVNLVVDAMKVQPGQCILDAGCGTGVLLHTVAEMEPDVDLIGVEQQPSAIKLAQNKLGNNGRIVQEDLNADVWTRELVGQIDTLVSVNALYILQDPLSFLRSAQEVLKPGGRMVLVNPHRMSWQPILNEHYGWMEQSGSKSDPRFEEALAQVIEFNQRIVQAAQDRTYHFLPPADLVAKCQQAGFTVRHVSPHVYSGTSVLIQADHQNAA